MSETPKLQAPGAGLPFFEGLVARFYVGGYLSKKDSVEKNWRRFEKLNKAILVRTKDLTLEQIHKKVLVPKLKGIEDSSRNWSVSETLEHLEIVGDSMIPLIEALSQKQSITKKVNIADFKPQGKYSEIDPRPDFEKFTPRVLSRLKGLHIAHEKPLFYHPWLGSLSALQWQWLLSSHSAIHFNQIEHIMKGLPLIT